jgi:23S rRNA (guanine2445-N2)-methyltransferase / 23S rRNA (guanine2069-N7)-methyltransferase
VQSIIGSWGHLNVRFTAGGGFEEGGKRGRQMMTGAADPRPLLRLFATSARGLEQLMAGELRDLGATHIKETRAGCGFAGTVETAYRVCLWSRLASRVLLPLAEVEAPDADRLYAGVKDLAWERHLSATGTLAVDFTSAGSPITHTHFGALRVKDAVVDRFRELQGIRPSIDTRRPDVRIYAHASRETAVVGLDLAGEALHRRGYREEGVQVQAPLKESLAAAVLLRSGWPETAAAGGGLLDPMCGSGTLPIEAALMACDVAPGLFREHWGFSGWLLHDVALWDGILEEARARRRAGLERVPPIVGLEVDPRAVRLALRAVERAGLRGVVHVERKALAQMSGPPFAAKVPGLVVVNPPYGERLGGGASLGPLYAELGRHLREGFLGWRAAVLTSDPQLARWTGLRSHRSYSLYNGALAVKLYLFDLRPDRFMGAPRRASASATAESVPAADGVDRVPPPDPAGPPPSETQITPGAGRAAAGVEMLSNRLRKNLKRLRKWAEREGITCYRLYDADLPEYAVAIDVYERWVHVQEYEAPSTIDPARAQARLRDVLDAATDVLDLSSDDIFLKVRRRQRGSAQYEARAGGPDFLEVSEGGLRFLVDLGKRLDTGLFLDHRMTRALLREEADQVRFLNLFSYTGTATVYAAAGGARQTTSVDLSGRYLDWAARNLRLNGFEPGGIEVWRRAPGERGGGSGRGGSGRGGPGRGRDPGGGAHGRGDGSGAPVAEATHRLVQADCLEWLEAGQGARERSYDLIFLDPPTFSNSKRMGESILDIQRDHVDLIRRTMRVLAPTGTLIFSTNNRRFRLAKDALSDLAVEDLSRKTLPPDFERTPRIHSCWRIRHHS